MDVKLTYEGGETETRPFSPELARLLVRAARANRAASRGEKFNLSFTTLLYALLISDDTYSKLFQGYAHAVGVDRKTLLDRKGLDDASLERLAVDTVTDFDTQQVFSQTVSAKNILANAAELAERTSSAEVDVRHLVGALVYRPATHGADLERLGLGRARWSEAFLVWIRDSHPSEAAVWQELAATTFARAKQAAVPTRTELQQTPAPNEPPTTTTPRLTSKWDRPTHQSDTVPDQVKLDLDCLGLRADAERFAKLLAAQDVTPPIALGLFGNWGAGKSFFMGMLRTRIDELSQTPDESRKFVARVAQITFNAWHYHDTNLWASLTLRIFDGLAETLAGDKKDTVQEKRLQLRKEIDSSKRQRDDAERERDAAQDKRAAAATLLAEEERKRRAADAALSVKRIERVHAELKGDKAFMADVERVQGLAEALGVPKADRTTPAQIEARAGELAALAEQGRTVSAAIVASARGNGNLVTVGLVVGLVVVAEVVMRRIGASATTAGLLQLCGVVFPVVGRVLGRAQWVTEAFESAKRARATVAKKWNESVPSDAEEESQKELDRIDAQIAAYGAEIAQAEQRTAAAEAELQRVDAGGLVYDFLVERRGADRYQAELGLVSTVRKDLDELGKRFKASAKPPIDRIVLYIDDLDRCQPAKVVEVLQAVHLLLAFDLFNVVVGVDPRWLERALERSYGDGGVRRGKSTPFSPQNYLEKIFQVPYSLSAMDETGFGRLVDELVLTHSEWEKEEEAKGKRPKEAPKGEPAPAPAPAKKDAPVADRTQQTEPAQPIDLREEVTALYFEDFEQTFIQRLHAFIRTPRLAKRLVNIYRLLRARASEEDFDRFLASADTGSYRAALVLLAINVGFPRVGGKVLYALSRQPVKGSWKAFVAGLDQNGAWSDVEKVDLAAIQKHLTALGDLGDDIESWVHWAPRVGRYSFDWHLVDA